MRADSFRKLLGVRRQAGYKIPPFLRGRIRPVHVYPNNIFKAHVWQFPSAEFGKLYLCRPSLTARNVKYRLPGVPYCFVAGGSVVMRMSARFYTKTG
jgi:hypothetical protein